MRLTRVYVETQLIPGRVTELPRDSAAHLSKVLRARVGDEFILFNGDGREFVGTIEAISGARVSAAIGEGREVNRESPIAVTLLQCVPRGDRMDFIVQKAAELGVARIAPVLSQRSVVRLAAEQASSKRAHWQAVAISACEQCGRNRLPTVETPTPLLSYLGALQGDASLRVVFEPSVTVASVLPSSLREPSAAPALILAIGPEGGLAEDELEAFELAGFKCLSLGSRILRTETAAIAALTWAQIRYGDMSAKAGSDLP